MIHFAFIDSKKVVDNTAIQNSVSDLFIKLDFNFELVEEFNFELDEVEEGVYQFFIFTNDEIRDPICLGKITIMSFNSNKEMHIEIHYDDEDIKIDSKTFKTIHNLKDELKSLFRSEWNECVWLEDSQSQYFAEKLYADIYKVENKLRNFINLLMIRRKGIKWWEKYIGNKITGTSKQGEGDYKRLAPLYKNVDSKLLSINTDHLKDIMVYKQKVWEPIYDSKVEDWLISSNDSNMSSNMKKVRERLLDAQFKVKVDLWTDIFKHYFKEDFKNMWDEFTKNRNHIAHNKLIDLPAYHKMVKNIEEVWEAIKVANDGFEMTDKSFEEKEKLSRIYVANEIEQAKVEAGVQIYSEEYIHELFDNDVSNMVYQISDSLYFRPDIEIANESSITLSDKTGVLSIKSKLSDDYLIEIFADHYLIDDSAGGLSESYVHIYLIDEEVADEIDSYHFSFVNGDYSYNEEQSNYMPETYEEFNKIDVDAIIDKVEELVEIYLLNKIKELEEWQRSESIDGGKKVVGEFCCEECGAQTVSIYDEFYEFGRCITCGHSQESSIEKCIKCSDYTNELSSFELCETCQDLFDSE